MSKIDNLFNEIESNRHNEYNCIPFGFNRAEPYLPGILRSTYYQITASSGIGKSKFTRYYFIFAPINFYLKNPNCGIKPKIFLNPLEEGERKFILSFVSMRLREKHGISIGVRDLLSVGKTRLVTNEIMKLINEIKEEYKEKIAPFIVINETIRNPYGIYKFIRGYAASNGTFYYQENSDSEVVSIPTPYDSDGNQINEFRWNIYKPNDPTEQVIIITDHISLLATERDHPTQHATMGNWSNNYCLKLRDLYGFTVVNVQQQEASKEKKQFTMRGESIDEKLEPSLDGLANN